MADPNAVKITLYKARGKFTLVDKEDYEKLELGKYVWRLNHKGYAKSRGAGMLHRFIIGAPKDMEVHHINGNKLDNRRKNLQLVTREEHVEIHKKLLEKKKK